jgi:hypothetical protein
MFIIEPEVKKDAFPMLELGDIIVHENKIYTLMKHDQTFMFTNNYGGGYNGRYDSLKELSEYTSKNTSINQGTARLYRSSEYMLHIVPK